MYGLVHTVKPVIYGLCFGRSFPCKATLWSLIFYEIPQIWGLFYHKVICTAIFCWENVVALRNKFCSSNTFGRKNTITFRFYWKLKMYVFVMWFYLTWEEPCLCENTFLEKMWGSMIKTTTDPHVPCDTCKKQQKIWPLFPKLSVKFLKLSQQVLFAKYY